MKLVGSRAGVILAAQSAAMLAFGLLGGVYADRWDRRRTMIAADATFFAIAVAALPVLARWGALGIAEFAVVAVVLGAAGALFTPALYASLPDLVANPEDLHATNALIDITVRLARILGPAFAIVLATKTSTLSFFTLDAVSFCASAAALLSLGGRRVWRSTQGKTVGAPRSIASDIALAVRIARRHAPIAWSLVILGITSLAWAPAFVMGAPLFAERILGRDVGAYGALATAYGIGNITGNLLVGSARLRKPTTAIFGGKVSLGLGFLGLALAPSLPIAFATTMIAGFGGAAGDVPTVTMVQREVQERCIEERSA